MLREGYIVKIIMQFSGLIDLTDLYTIQMALYDNQKTYDIMILDAKVSFDEAISPSSYIEIKFKSKTMFAPEKPQIFETIDTINKIIEYVLSVHDGEVIFTEMTEYR
jgi:hypothetical protein